MRILVAVHGFPPAYYAGGERAAERIVRWLHHKHHYVEVFTVEKVDEAGFRVETSIQDGVTIHRLYYNIKVGQDPFRNLYDDPRIDEAYREVLGRGQFDLVHLVSGYLLGGQLIHTAHDFGVPIIVTLTEYWFMCVQLNLIRSSGDLCSGPESDVKCARCIMQQKRRYRILNQPLQDIFWTVAERTLLMDSAISDIVRRRMFLHRALDDADLVICPSRFIISKFAEFGFDTRNFQFIRHGLPESNVQKPLNKTRRGGDELRLGYIGQIKSHKGVDLIIDAIIPLLEAGHKITLDLWGPDSETPNYAAKLRRRSAIYPSIRWNGRYEGSKVWEILSNFDALIVPSRWYENSPTVILEAYKMGLPVVATNLGGMAELVEHEKTGLLFELNSSEDLRRQLQRLVTEVGLLEKLRAGLPMVKTADQEVEEIFEQYTQLLDQVRER